MKSIFLKHLALLAILGSAHACKSSPPPIPQLPPEQKARYGETWAIYQKNDAAWPARRDAAMADAMEREFLIQNWIREVVRGADEAKSANLAKSPRAERARAELIQVGAHAAPLLMALFAAKDPAVADHSARILAKMGEGALPSLVEGASDKEALTRRWSILSLSWMEPPREEGRVVESLKDPDWSVRGAAAQALTRYKSADSAKALARALRDSDPFVRSQAAESLGSRGESDQVPALIAYLRDCNARFSLDEAYTAKTALFALTRKNFGTDAKQWQEWWNQGRKKP